MISDTNYSHACPRCGYDQSGLIATWQNSCPLSGTCSECGLEFEWTDVLHAHTNLNLKFVEHAPLDLAGLRMFVAAWRTLAWAVIPWMFWERVKLHHRVRPLRWPVWVLLTLGVLRVVTAVLSSFLYLARYGSIAATNGATWQTRSGQGLPSPTTWTWTDFQILVLAHLGRPFVAIDSFSPYYSGPTPGTTSGPWSVIWLVPKWPPLPWLCLSVGLAFPLLLLFLPDTRKVAKVRMAHILRAFVYSLAGLMLLSILQGLRLALLFGGQPKFSPAMGAWKGDDTVYAVDDAFWGDWNYPLCILAMLWLSCWWYVCIKHGIKLRRPGLVWAVLMIPVLLVAMITVLYTDTYIWGKFLWGTG